MLPRGFLDDVIGDLFDEYFTMEKLQRTNGHVQINSLHQIKFTMRRSLNELLQYAEPLMLLILKKQYCLFGHAQYIGLM